MLTVPSNQAQDAMDSVNPYQAPLFRRACRQLDPAGDLELAILLTPDGMTTSEMKIAPELEAAVAGRARTDWDQAARTVQIQYVHFDGYDDPLVLYSKPLGDSQIVLVARSDVLLGRLRQTAESLVRILSEGEAGLSTNRAFTIESIARDDAGDNAVYAIAWRPVEPLPQAVRNVIRDSARNVARRNGCQLEFVGVASDHVHLVLRCPPQRSESWAAHLFKRGIEEDITRRFGTSAILWQKGYLADSSGHPIGGEALTAYLRS
jgi:REP element-mobilizing transposase RayT